jgi:hypothetical protein
VSSQDTDIVAYNTTKNDPEKLYLYDNQIKEALISKDIFGNYIGIIPDLKKKLEDHGCNVEIDWQFDTAKPLYWWTPEYSGNKPGSNLISNYNIIIFLGHGDDHRIYFTINNTYVKGNKIHHVNYTDFLDYVTIGNRKYVSSHMHNKGWILFVACNVLKTRDGLIPLFTGVPLIGVKIKNISLGNTYLLAAIGFRNELVIGYRNLLGQTFLTIDFFLDRLIDHLVDNAKNIQEAWYEAYKEYARYVVIKRKASFKEASPAILYPIIYFRVKDNYYAESYNPLTNIYNINYISSPAEVYNSLPRDKIVIDWQYVYYGGGLKGILGFKIGHVGYRTFSPTHKTIYMF